MIRERSFFEVAATLLPVLLLTGVLTPTLRPPPAHEKVKDWRFYLIISGVVLGSFAELSALRVVTTGRATNFDRTIVPLAIVGLGAAIVSPWLTRLAEGHPGWRKHVRLMRAGFLLLIILWGWSTVQLYRNIFELGDTECIVRKTIDWPGGPNSNIFDQGIVPRQVALDQIAIFHARRAAQADGKITKDERSEREILKLLLDHDMDNWRLELDLDLKPEC